MRSKKIATCFALIFVFCTVVKAQPYIEFSYDCKLSKTDCFNRIDEWLALNKTIYNIKIDYRNPDYGKYIINGETEDEHCHLYCVSYGGLSANFTYTLSIEIKDNICKLSFRNVVYNFSVTSYVDYDYLSTSMLKIIRDELNIIERGNNKLSIDERFKEKYRRLDESRQQLKSIADDETKKKKERKRAKNTLEETQGEYNVYLYCSSGPGVLFYDLSKSLSKLLK